MNPYENLRSGAAVRKKDMFEEYRKEAETPGENCLQFPGDYAKMEHDLIKKKAVKMPVDRSSDYREDV